MKNSLIMAEAEAICLTCLISKMIPVQMVVSYPFHCAYNDFYSKLWVFNFFWSAASAWDYSAWVRTYALYLEERLECFRVLKYDVETDRPVSSFFPPTSYHLSFSVELYLTWLSSFGRTPTAFFYMLYLHFKLSMWRNRWLLEVNYQWVCFIEKKKKKKN